MLFVLRGDVGFDCLMAAVVWPGRNLVDENAAFAGDKHFNSEKSDHAEVADDLARNEIGFRCNGWRKVCRGKKILDEIVLRVEYHLHHGKSLYLAPFVAGGDNRNFLFEVD